SLAATAAWDLRASSRAFTAASFRLHAPLELRRKSSARASATCFADLNASLRPNLYDTFCPRTYRGVATGVLALRPSGGILRVPAAGAGVGGVVEDKGYSPRPHR